MPDCAKYQEMISAMLDGELTEAEQTAVEAHIAFCADCRAMYEAFAAISGALDSEEVPEVLHSSIMEKVNAAAKATKTQQKIVRLRPILTAVACLVVIVGTVFALKGNLPGMKSADTAAPAAAEAPMMMAFSGAAGAADAPSAASDQSNGTATETYSVTEEAGTLFSEECAPAEAPRPEPKADAKPENDSYDNAVEAPMKAKNANTVSDGRQYDYVLTVKAMEPFSAVDFPAEVVDAGDVPCKIGDIVEIVIDENTEPFSFDILSGGEYRISVEGYEKTVDQILIYAAEIRLT